MLVIPAVVGLFVSYYFVFQVPDYNSTCKKAGYDGFVYWWFGSTDTIKGKLYIKCYDKTLTNDWGGIEVIRQNERWIPYRSK